jgi:hypothetical protein
MGMRLLLSHRSPSEKGLDIPILRWPDRWSQLTHKAQHQHVLYFLYGKRIGLSDSRGSDIVDDRAGVT